MAPADPAVVSSSFMRRDMFARRDAAIRREILRVAPALTLDVGCGGLRRGSDLVQGRPYLCTDIRSDVPIDFRSSAFDLPVATSSVEAVLALEVLEHVTDPARVLSETARVLTPGGIVMVSVPSSVPRHDSHDYWRFTAEGLRELATPFFKECKVEVFGGTFETLAALAEYYWALVAHRTWWPLRHATRPLLGMARRLDDQFAWATDTEGLHTLAFDLLLVARCPVT